MHGITHFDGKAWQTLPMLLFKPGKLTRDYIMGKRARYIAPVPLSLPWLWLLFAWRREVRMYDHAIFALYSISFMSLLFIIASVALALDIGAAWFWGSLSLAPLVHMFAQLKGACAIGRFGAAWRTLALSFASVITLSLYAMLMIVIGVLDWSGFAIKSDRSAAKRSPAGR